MGKDLKKKDLGKGITQQKNKKYRVRFKVSEDYEIDQEFDSERAAKAFLETAKYEVEHGMVLSQRSTTVNEVFKKWIGHKIATDRADILYEIIEIDIFLISKMRLGLCV